MYRPLAVLLIGSLALAGCNSKLNPANWFGSGRSVPVQGSADNALIPEHRPGLLSRREAPDLSQPIAQVSDLVVERKRGGAILRATGVATRQGAFEARLVPTDPELRPDETATLTFDFLVVYPEGETETGSTHTRSITAAYSLTDHQLENIRAIQVRGAENALESRR